MESFLGNAELLGGLALVEGLHLLGNSFDLIRPWAQLLSRSRVRAKIELPLLLRFESHRFTRGMFLKQIVTKSDAYFYGHFVMMVGAWAADSLQVEVLGIRVFETRFQTAKCLIGLREDIPRLEG